MNSSITYSDAAHKSPIDIIDNEDPSELYQTTHQKIFHRNIQRMNSQENPESPSRYKLGAYKINLALEKPQPRRNLYPMKWQSQ